MNIIVVILVGSIFNFCSFSDQKPTIPLNDHLEIEGAEISTYTIIPYDSTFWRVPENGKQAELTKIDVDLIDRILNESITEYNSAQDMRNNTREIEGNKSRSENLIREIGFYRRQYVPFINTKGEKEVWINCFCKDWGQDVTKEILIVDDGGKCYFNLIINLTTRKYYAFAVNGDA